MIYLVTSGKEYFVTRLYFMDWVFCATLPRVRARRWLAGALLLLAWLSGACRSTQSPPQPATAGARAVPSAQIAVRHEIGFASRQKLVEHYEKHGREFGAVDQAEYLRQAQTLRDRPAGNEVLEVVRDDGVITRFDRSSGAFLAFNPDLTIRTFFKPNAGEAYFRRQSKRSTDEGRR